MESVHFYEKKLEKEVIDMLKLDEFMRISHIVREYNSHSDKKGCVLYVNASQSETDSIAQKLEEIGAEKIIGDEEKTIIETFRAEEDCAASGIGLMFG